MKKSIHLIAITFIVVSHFGFSQEVLWNQSGNNYSVGNLGIGTTSPNSKLEIQDESPVLTLDATAAGGDSEIFFDTRINNGSNYNTARIIADGASGGIAPSLSFYVIDGDGSGWDRTLNIKPTDGLDDSGNVGIGTSSPLSRLHISTNEDAISWNLTLNNTRNSSTVSGYGAGIKLKHSGNHEGYKWGGIATVQEGSWANLSGLALYANEAERIRIKHNGNVGIGTTNPDEKLAVKGKIHAEEVKVDLSVPGPDYVFEPTYNLRTLEETEAYIQSNKHLPEIPSAKEMEANGVQLGEMNMLLLKKIEELTLHLIEANKTSQQQIAKAKSQDKKIEELTLHTIEQEKKLSAQQKEIDRLKNSPRQPQAATPLFSKRGEETEGRRGELEKKIEELLERIEKLEKTK